ncbi:unnamed protein product [Gordionus sp. m RMFG-2023]
MLRFSFILLVISPVRTFYKFVLQPHDVTAVSGRDVLLPCRIAFEDKKLVSLSSTVASVLPAMNGDSGEDYSMNVLEDSEQGNRGDMFPTEKDIPQVQWVKNGFALGTYSDMLEYSSKMSIRGNMKKGIFHLAIISVSEEDSGTYQCQISPAEDYDAVVSYKANLTVLTPPGNPIILNGPSIQANQNSVLNVTCMAKDGFPPNSLNIYFSPSNFKPDQLNQSSWDASITNSRLKWIYKTVSIRATEVLNGASVVCESAPGPTKTVPRSLNLVKTARTLLDVRYPPLVSITGPGIHTPISPSVLLVREGAKVKLTCSVRSNPSAHELDWFSNGVPLVTGRENKEDNTFSYAPVTRHHHGDSMKCTARNGLGTGSAHVTLNVEYTPQFVTRPPSTLPIDLSQTGLNISCLADGNPVPIYSWRKLTVGLSWINSRIDHMFRHADSGPPLITTHLTSNDQTGKEVSSGPYLLFDRTTNRDAGHYACSVIQKSSTGASSLTTITTQSEVLIKGPPIIHKLDIKYVKMGNNEIVVLLVCVIRAAPLLKSINWYSKGALLNPNNTIHDIKNIYDEEDYWAISSLTTNIPIASDNSSALIDLSFTNLSIAFDCEAVNARGRDSLSTKLSGSRVSALVLRRAPLRETRTDLDRPGSARLNDVIVKTSTIPLSRLEKSLPWVLSGFGLVLCTCLGVGGLFYALGYKRRQSRELYRDGDYKGKGEKDGKEFKLDENDGKGKNIVALSDNRNGQRESKEDKDQKIKSKNQTNNERLNTSLNKDFKNIFKGEKEISNIADSKYVGKAPKLSIKEYNFIENISSDSALSCDGSEEASSDKSTTKNASLAPTSINVNQHSISPLRFLTSSRLYPDKDNSGGSEYRITNYPYAVDPLPFISSSRPVPMTSSMTSTRPFRAVRDGLTIYHEVVRSPMSPPPLSHLSETYTSTMPFTLSPYTLQYGNDDRRCLNDYHVSSYGHMCNDYDLLRGSEYSRDNGIILSPNVTKLV